MCLIRARAFIKFLLSNEWENGEHTKTEHNTIIKRGERDAATYAKQRRRTNKNKKRRTQSVQGSSRATALNHFQYEIFMY